MHGLPVVTDPNIPVDQGTGNNEDPVFVARAFDLVLWERGIRARVLPETKATTLTVLLQIYSYLAFSAARYPQSGVEITGLTAPTFLEGCCRTLTRKSGRAAARWGGESVHRTR